MRQVDEIHHPERHRQEEQQHPVGKAVEQNAERRADHAGARAMVSITGRLSAISMGVDARQCPAARADPVSTSAL